jgi:hypothetical protein
VASAGFGAIGSRSPAYAWRGAHECDGNFAGYIAYAESANTGDTGIGMLMAAVTGDETLIGYAKQMLTGSQRSSTAVPACGLLPIGRQADSPPRRNGGKRSQRPAVLVAKRRPRLRHLDRLFADFQVSAQTVPSGHSIGQLAIPRPDVAPFAGQPFGSDLIILTAVKLGASPRCQVVAEPGQEPVGLLQVALSRGLIEGARVTYHTQTEVGVVDILASDHILVRNRASIV